MFVGVVLAWLGNAVRGISLLLERYVVRGPEITVAPPDGLDLHLGEVVLGNAGDEPRELPGGGVVLAPDRLPDRCLGRGFGGRDAFGEEPDEVGPAHAVVTGARADDVVAEHSL